MYCVSTVSPNLEKTPGEEGMNKVWGAWEGERENEKKLMYFFFFQYCNMVIAIERRYKKMVTFSLDGQQGQSYA